MAVLSWRLRSLTVLPFPQTHGRLPASRTPLPPSLSSHSLARTACAQLSGVTFLAAGCLGIQAVFFVYDCVYLFGQHRFPSVLLWL